MKNRTFSNTALLLLAGTLLTAQSLSTPPIVDVATGARCVAAFSPATGATHVQVDCSNAGVAISTTRVSIASITGAGQGFAFSFNTGTDAITVLLKRPAAAANLQIDAAVNGGVVSSRSVPVP
jgi:hypothetical protein